MVAEITASGEVDGGRRGAYFATDNVERPVAL